MHEVRPGARRAAAIAIAAGLAALCVLPAHAGDAKAGAGKAMTCVACHGPQGISIVPIYPNLACQKEQYLIDSLKQYKNGQRDNAIMKPMVASLSDVDIVDLAAYFAQLGCK